MLHEVDWLIVVFFQPAHRPMRTSLSILAIAIEVTMILTLVGVSCGTSDGNRASRPRGRRGYNGSASCLSMFRWSTALIRQAYPAFLSAVPTSMMAMGTVVVLLEGFDTVTGIDFDHLKDERGLPLSGVATPFQKDNDILIDDFLYARTKLPPLAKQCPSLLVMTGILVVSPWRRRQTRSGFA